MRHTIFDTPIVNLLTRFASRLFLRLSGWRAVGDKPVHAKYVLIAAPHTSNWDLPIMMAIAFYLGIKIYWMGKESLFHGVLGPIARYCGGIPIDRSRPGGMVGQTIEKFNESERLAVVVPAEGTRQRVAQWKSGFYHIACGASVPIQLGYLDYSRKEGGVGPSMMPTGNVEADMSRIREFYADIRGKFPEQESVPRLGPPS